MDEPVHEIFTNQETQHLEVYALSTDLLVHPNNHQWSMDGSILSTQIQAAKHILRGFSSLSLRTKL